MGTCPSCRADNADSARFCTTCGTSLVPRCTACGGELPAAARFCPACGAAVADDEPPRDERKTVTVVFADLVDSTGHGERLDPEDLRGLLVPYFLRVREE